MKRFRICAESMFYTARPSCFRPEEDDFYDFRKRIADKFEVSFHEIYIIGSEKMGFSTYKQTDFGYDSDIDVCIISESLFNNFMEIIRDFQMSVRSARRSISADEIRMYHEFLEYVAIGWIRPDKLPVSFRVGDLKNDWFKFFDSISHGKSEVGNYKVSAGVFRTYRHLEIYSLSGLSRIQKTLEVVQKKT